MQNNCKTKKKYLKAMSSEWDNLLNAISELKGEL